jgi:hypothetical protein
VFFNPFQSSNLRKPDGWCAPGDTEGSTTNCERNEPGRVKVREKQRKKLSGQRRSREQTRAGWYLASTILTYFASSIGKPSALVRYASDHSKSENKNMERRKNRL